MKIVSTFPKNSISNSQIISQSDLILSEHEIQADLYVNQILISRPTAVKACHVHLCWKLLCYIIHQSNTVKSIKHRYLNNVLLNLKKDFTEYHLLHAKLYFVSASSWLWSNKVGSRSWILVTCRAIEGGVTNQSLRKDIGQFNAEIFCQIIFCLDWG